MSFHNTRYIEAILKLVEGRMESSTKKNHIAYKVAHLKHRKLEGKETMISKFKENYFQHNILYQRNSQEG